ncbi:MAG: hypothetical protein AB8B84_11670 [Granulosicoccus sp.]
MSASLFVRTLSVIALTVLCSACSITQTHKHSEQQATLSRWYQCVERHTAAFSGSILDMQQTVLIRCEGHQRDVLATYPEHLEDRVNTLLSEHTEYIAAQHFLRSSNVAPWSALNEADNDSLGVHLTGALPDDL